MINLYDDPNRGNEVIRIISGAARANYGFEPNDIKYLNECVIMRKGETTAVVTIVRNYRDGDFASRYSNYYEITISQNYQDVPFHFAKYRLPLSTDPGMIPDSIILNERNPFDD
jgi:hypothetical protein